MINSNWTRWIMASASVYFKAVADTIPLDFLVDGVNERESETQETDHSELRINGPFIVEQSKNFYHLEVDLNILVTDLMKETGESAYDIATWCGVFQLGMDGPISIYKYGGVAGDDSSLVGCLTPRTGKYDANKVLHFGMIDRVDRIRQSMIDGKFEMYIDTN